MTKRQINLSFNKIEKSKKEGYYLEALLNNYHLNIGILKFIFEKLNPGRATKNIKPKQILNELMEEMTKKKGTGAISKKTFKPLKPWLIKMDTFLKLLKTKQPSNTKNLLNESEKIFFLLNISHAKMNLSK